MLNFMAEHPFLTVIILAIIFGGTHDIVVAARAVPSCDCTTQHDNKGEK